MTADMPLAPHGAGVSALPHPCSFRHVVSVLFLVLFSYAFFYKGFTGLAITIGSILTLFVVMQMTGRIQWKEQFAKFQPGNSIARDTLGA
jgi:hypothetical protein